jgi:hypothetical protein
MTKSRKSDPSRRRSQPRPRFEIRMPPRMENVPSVPVRSWDENGCAPPPATGGGGGGGSVGSDCTYPSPDNPNPNPCPGPAGPGFGADPNPAIFPPDPTMSCSNAVWNAIDAGTISMMPCSDPGDLLNLNSVIQQPPTDPTEFAQREYNIINGQETDPAPPAPGGGGQLWSTGQVYATCQLQVSGGNPFPYLCQSNGAAAMTGTFLATASRLEAAPCGVPAPADPQSPIMNPPNLIMLKGISLATAKIVSCSVAY